MPPLSGAQRSSVSQFVAVTGATKEIAVTILKRYGWKMEQATDAFYAQGSLQDSPANSKIEANLEALFEKYRDKTNDEKDVVSVNGTMAYLTDLGVDLEDASSLIPLEIIQAPSLGEMAKAGFIKGWKAVGSPKAAYDDISKQKAFIATQIPLLSTDMNLFKRVYKHTFICSKDKGLKALPRENAMIYWQMLFAPPGMAWVTGSTNWLELWLEYLNAKWTKSVNKDMWNMTFEFFQKSLHDDQLSFWSEDGAWPGVIDDFVLYVKEKRGPATDMMETD